MYATRALVNVALVGIPAFLFACAPSSTIAHGLRVSKWKEKIELGDPARVVLGRALFFDAGLSSSGKMSCSTCHDPALGFGDGRRLAVGKGGEQLRRHAPSLFNLALGEHFFWDGRSESLEKQALEVIENPLEFDTTLEAIVNTLRADPNYQRAFQKAFREGLTGQNVLRAIADFERSLVAFDSPFDRYLSGDTQALSSSAKRGYALFEGQAGCVNCHSGANFSDGDFHNTGVPTSDKGRLEVDRNVRFRMRPYPFLGHYKAFKTPTLRNVALSPPYFHNGIAATLRDVVNFYRVGGLARDEYGRSPDVHPLDLSQDDVADLVAFLESLTESEALH